MNYLRAFEQFTDKYHKISDKCIKLDLTDEVIKFVRKFDSDEELLRAGGLPTDMFDKLAFGFNENLNTINPNKLKIKWHTDLEQVEYEIKQSRLTPEKYSLGIDITEPIDVSYETNEYGTGFFIEDGHHRYFAAKTLGKSLKMNLTINSSPTEKLGYSNYDVCMRCIYGQVMQ
jgi:hypothetical protein